nr:hypothetical protein [Alphaproteobacteria bacterium]
MFDSLLLGILPFRGENGGAPLLAMAPYILAALAAGLVLLLVRRFRGRGAPAKKTSIFSRRFFLSVGGGILFALPLVVVVGQSVSVLNEDIVAARRELMGVNYHEVLVDLLLDVQDVRDISRLARKDAGFLPALQAKKASLRRWLEQAEAATRAYAAGAAPAHEWAAIRAQILTLTDKPEDGAAAPFARYSGVIEELSIFMESLADRYGITNDPQLDSDFLADAAVNVTPLIIQTLGQLRGAVAGLVASGRLPAQWSEAERRPLQAL